jgi:hypothetical protein
MAVCDHGLMLVWLTDWQLGEDHVLIRVGDVVDWTLYRSDRVWLSRLFADRLNIEWQFDTYGDAVPQPSRRVRGEVTALMSVHCPQVTDEGRVPVAGAARLSPVEDTSGSWMNAPGASEGEAPQGDGSFFYTFSYVNPSGDDASDSLYGYVLTLDLRLDEAEV